MTQNNTIFFELSSPEERHDTKMKRKSKIPVIGLTGGAGSGKSYIAGLLETVGRVYHINTDEISRAQMQKGGCVYQKVLEQFGLQFLNDDGEINRKMLGEYVFPRPEKLKLLNEITHPPVKKEVSRVIEEAANAGYDVILLESALLIEAGYKEICDEIWYVYAKRQVRKQRLQDTRGYSETRIRDMFRSQKTDAFFRSHADYVIDNNGQSREILSERLRRRLHKIEKSI